MLRARRTGEPLIDLSLLAVPTFRAAIVGGSIFRVGVGAMPFLLPLQLQIGFGRTALESGLTTFVAAIGAIAMKFTARPIIARYGFRATLTVDAVIAGGMMAALAAIGPSTPVAAIWLLLLVGGFFRSLEFTAINVVAYCEIDETRTSRATAFSSMMQQLSLSAGVGLGALTLHLLGAGEGGNTPASAFSIALGTVGVVSMLSAFAFGRIAPGAGRDMLAGRGGAAAD